MSDTIMIDGVYDHPLERITDLNPFLTYEKDGSVTFTGKSLECRIPLRYKQYGLLDIGNVVNALGLMDVIIDNKYQCSLAILAQISLAPSEIEEKTILGEPYLICKWSEHGTFLTSLDFVKNSTVTYAIYVEYITRGHRLYTIGYNDIPIVFDRLKEFTGKGIGVGRSAFELLVSHLGRAHDNLYKQYRYTDLKYSPVIINLRSVSFAPTTTTSRLLGSYFDDGMNSALLSEQKQRQPFEDLLRGVPVESDK